jgi:hypothetical protein
MRSRRSTADGGCFPASSLVALAGAAPVSAKMYGGPAVDCPGNRESSLALAVERRAPASIHIWNNRIVFIVFPMTYVASSSMRVFAWGVGVASAGVIFSSAMRKRWEVSKHGKSRFDKRLDLEADWAAQIVSSRIGHPVRARGSLVPMRCCTEFNSLKTPERIR